MVNSSDQFNKSISGENKKLIIATAFVMFLLFLADIMVPLGVALGVLYIICLFILLPIRNKDITLGFAALSTFLIVVAFMILLNDQTNWMVYANRLISLAAVWITAFLIVRYNTRLELANKKLLNHAQQIESKNKELEQFVYIASHDLQEPLRTITSFTELLEKKYGDNLDKDATKYMNFIIEATERMRQLIKGLLDYGRIGRNPKYIEVDCNDLLKEIKIDLADSISKSKAEIIVGNLPLIKAYETELRLLFQNILSNAIKFQRPGNSPQISINAVQQNGYWKFSISDNGIGIAENYSNRIFKIFQRLHDRDQYEGTGIGLAHCSKVVELHGGEIWVDSNDQRQGSTFHFTIPRG